MRTPWQGHEGPRPRVMIGPGCVTVSRPDLARHERTRERAEERRRLEADMLARYYAEHGRFPDQPESTRRITAWSWDSKARMVKAFCSLDYAPMLSDPGRLPAMVTLTYPGDWLTVAPDGKAAKAHLFAFRRRYQRAWGEPLSAIWKLEFQSRGAPHFHLLMVPPHGLAGTTRQAAAKRYRPALGDGLGFRQWLSAVWADIVSHPDPVQRMSHERAGTNVNFSDGMKSSDPMRVAVYFLKHSSGDRDGESDLHRRKGYQHVVPEAWQEQGKGPGRFWGYWTLERLEVGREVSVTDAVRTARILRRMVRARGTTHEVRVTRTRGGRVLSEVSEVIGLAGAQLVQSRRTQRRRVRRPVRRLSSGAGWIAVNNGASMAVDLGRALAIWAA